MIMNLALTPALRVLRGATAGRFFELNRDVTHLGRDPACDIVMSSQTVSRRHARIERRSAEYYLVDLGSTCGTFLNGQALSGNSCLHEGDLIEIGDVLLVFSGVTPDLSEHHRNGESTVLKVRDATGSAEHSLIGIRPEEKLRAILEIGRALVGPIDLDLILDRVLDALFRLFPQADRGFVFLHDDGHADLTPTAIKVREGDSTAVTVSRTVLDYVTRHGKAVLSADVTVDSRFEASRSVDEAQIRTMMCVPLRDHERRPVGILQLDTSDRKAQFNPSDLDVLAAVAGQVGVAVDNARLLDEASRRRDRLEFLAEAGDLLVSSLDYEASAATLARLAVPRLADICLIDMSQPDGTIKRVAAAHADPSKQPLVDELRFRFAPDSAGPHPVVRVLQTGRPELVDLVDEAQLRAETRSDEHWEIVQRLGFHAYMLLPLMARGRVLGVISLISTGHHQRHGWADLALAEELARRAALAIDNAALYHAAQEARAQAEAARRQAEEAGRAKDRFLAMLSHELRTPLTPAILAISGLLEDPAVPPSVRPDLETARRGIALEARLVDDLLDLTRVGTGKLRLLPERVDVHTIVHEALAACDDQLRPRSMTVHLDLAAPEAHVDADPARLQQILWNVIKNAAKFTPDGGTITVRTRNEPLSPPEPGVSRLVLEVIDTGIGIEPDVLPRIFNVFEQGGEDVTRRFGGLGLGLAICRAVAEMHGGSLTAWSAGRDQGATFRLELNTSPAPAPVAVDTPPATGPEASAKEFRILLVEDSADTLRILARLLGLRGYKVTTAPDFASALACAREVEFDLVISDIGLPDGSGLELLPRLREIRPTPGIALSGYGMEEDLRRSEEAGFCAHLIKPVDLPTLEAVIAQHCSSVR